MLTLQRDARAVLKAIRHLQDQLQKELPEPGDDSRVSHQRADHALVRARAAYAGIADDVIELRDRLLMYASPQGRVKRHPRVDALYRAPLTPESLLLIERDLSLLCLSLEPDGGYGSDSNE